MNLLFKKWTSYFKSNKSLKYILVAVLPLLMLCFQNCGNSGDTSAISSSGSSTLPSTGAGGSTTGGTTTSAGGFNRIAPTITNTLQNQILSSGLSGRFSGTRTLDNLEVTANPGDGESFQTVTLKCAITGHPDIQSDCNNKNFANGRVTFDIEPRDMRECLSGTANLRYWVEDSDPLSVGVPVLRSAERNITIQIQNTCYNEAQIYSTEKSGQDNFGTTVKITSQFLFSSAPGNDVFFSNSGAVVVYTKSGASWVQSQTLKMSQPAQDF